MNPKNEKELKLVTEFLEKFGVSNSLLTDEENDKLQLLIVMADGNRVEEAPREAIYKNVKGSVDEKYEFGLTDEDYRVLDERRARHLAGESASYSWQDVKEAVKNLKI